jgi:hypothetical protein
MKNDGGMPERFLRFFIAKKPAEDCVKSMNGFVLLEVLQSKMLLTTLHIGLYAVKCEVFDEITCIV